MLKATSTTTKTPAIHYATARKDYTCARCNQPILRGTVYARLERPPFQYHRECAPHAPHYGDDHIVADREGGD